MGWSAKRIELKQWQRVHRVEGDNAMLDETLKQILLSIAEELEEENRTSRSDQARDAEG